MVISARAYANTPSGWSCPRTLTSMSDQARLATQLVSFKRFTTIRMVLWERWGPAGKRYNLAADHALWLMHSLYIELSHSAQLLKIISMIMSVNILQPSRKCLFYSWFRWASVTFFTYLHIARISNTKLKLRWVPETLFYIIYILPTLFIKTISVRIPPSGSEQWSIFHWGSQALPSYHRLQCCIVPER